MPCRDEDRFSRTCQFLYTRGNEGDWKNHAVSCRVLRPPLFSCLSQLVTYMSLGYFLDTIPKLSSFHLYTYFPNWRIFLFLFLK